MNKKVIKEINYAEVQCLINHDEGIILNGENLDDINDYNEIVNKLNKAELLKDDDIIIPVGLELTNKFHNGYEYVYNFNNGFLIINLSIDDDEYLA